MSDAVNSELTGPRARGLVERLRPVAARRTGLVVGLVGEPGIGKTHAVRTALDTLTCHSYSLAAAGDVRTWAARLPRGDALTVWARRALDDVEAGATVQPADVAAAFGALLTASAPVVLHLEDLHECDTDRLGLVVQLARAVHRVKGVGLVVTSRDTTPEPIAPVRLAPLDAEASRTLLEGEAGYVLPARAVAWIIERAGGNPLYTLEYFRYLSRLGHLWNDGERWRWRLPTEGLIPTSVEALVGRRLLQAQADGGDAGVLAALAYLGTDAPVTLLAAVVDASVAEVEARLVHLTQAGVLADCGFTHPLFRELSLKSTTRATLQTLARRAITALAGDDLEAARFVEDAHLPAAESLAVLRSAAGAASDPVRAARLRARATRYATGETLTDLALASASVLQNTDLPEAIRVVGLASELGEPSREVTRLQVHLLARDGRQAEADELALTLGADADGASSAAVLQVTSRNVAGDHAGAWRIWSEHPELHVRDDPDLLRAATASALAVGRMQEATALIERGLATIDAPALRCELLSLKALLAFHSGDAAGADALIRDVLDRLEPLAAPRLRATALLNRAAFLKELGDFSAMGACLEECLDIRRQAGDGKAYAFAQAALAELRMEQGRHDEAGDLLAEAIATLELYGPSRFLANTRTLASALGLARGTPLGRLAALHNAEQALTLARGLGNPRVVREILFDASLAATATGSPERGLALAQESRAMAAVAGDSPTDNYRAAWAEGAALASLGRVEEALAALESAHQAAAAVEGAVDTHKIALELAALRRDRSALDAAAGWFAERGLLNGVAAAERLMPVAASPGAGSSRPRLEALGPLRVVVPTAGGAVEAGGADGTSVRGTKRRALLALLLEARVTGRGGVTRLALLDELYPGQDELSAAASLKVLVHGVRQSLASDLVVTTADGYALGECATDVEEFLAAPRASLWRGQYLAGEEFDAQVRDTLHLALARLVTDLARTDAGEAIRLGRILVEAEPYDLDHLAVCLSALRAGGQHRTLARQYQRSRERLAELGETLPTRWQDFLAASGGGHTVAD